MRWLHWFLSAVVSGRADTGGGRQQEDRLLVAASYLRKLTEFAMRERVCPLLFLPCGERDSEMGIISPQRKPIAGTPLI